MIQELKIIQQYIVEHSNPKTEYEKGFVSALEELKKCFTVYEEII